MPIVQRGAEVRYLRKNCFLRSRDREEVSSPHSSHGPFGRASLAAKRLVSSVVLASPASRFSGIRRHKCDSPQAAPPAGSISQNTAHPATANPCSAGVLACEFPQDPAVRLCGNTDMRQRKQRRTIGATPNKSVDQSPQVVSLFDPAQPWPLIFNKPSTCYEP
jgi:hypothetical protein